MVNIITDLYDMQTDGEKVKDLIFNQTKRLAESILDDDTKFHKLRIKIGISKISRYR